MILVTDIGVTGSLDIEGRKKEGEQGTTLCPVGIGENLEKSVGHLKPGDLARYQHSFRRRAEKNQL